MADDGSVYSSAAGFIQFPVETRDLDSGQTVRDATIRSIASGDLIRVTLWPDFEDADIEEGDFIAVDGKFTQREVKGKTYTNASARKLAVSKAVQPKEREVVKKNF